MPGTKKRGAKKTAPPKPAADQTRGASNTKNPLVPTLRHLARHHSRKLLLAAFKEYQEG